METKAFFDVFPDVKLDKTVENLFRQVVVRKVVMNLLLSI